MLRFRRAGTLVAGGRCIRPNWSAAGPALAAPRLQHCSTATARGAAALDGSLEGGLGSCPSSSHLAHVSPVVVTRLPPGSRSLAALAPAVAAQWHPTKNGATTPSDVTANCNTKYWFKCAHGPDHEWEATLNSRVSNGSGCPCCSGRKLSVTNSLATVAPDIAAQWHPTKNGAVNPASVVANSHVKFWFKCDRGPDHAWEATPRNRVAYGSGCPCCSGRKLSVTNSLATVAPHVAAQWHPTKNGAVLPSDVVAHSNQKYWFQCSAGDDHEWQAALHSRVGGNHGCPCCSGRKLSAGTTLAAVAPEVAAQWHPTKNGDIKPDQVMATGRRKFWFKCDRGPDHEWEAALRSRVTDGNGCPCCSGRKLSVTNSLATVAPLVAAQWHPTKNGAVTPEDIVANTTKKFWFQCNEGFQHEWESTPHRRVSNKSGCPLCHRMRSVRPRR